MHFFICEKKNARAALDKHVAAREASYNKLKQKYVEVTAK